MSCNDNHDDLTESGRLHSDRRLALVRDQLKALPIDEAATLVLDVGFCAGVAYREAGMTVDELVEKADHARCQAKQNPDIHCFVAGEVNA
jgi:hypothetical protein